MAQNVVINGVQYSDCPEVNIPKQNGGTAKFMDTDDANVTADKMLNGYSGYALGAKVNGNIQSKAAETYTPTTSDQTIAAGVYLSGAQTVKGDANLQSQYIAKNITIFGVNGSLSSPTISQDSTTKVLSIS